MWRDRYDRSELVRCRPAVPIGSLPKLWSTTNGPPAISGQALVMGTIPTRCTPTGLLLSHAGLVTTTRTASTTIMIRIMGTLAAKPIPTTSTSAKSLHANSLDQEECEPDEVLSREDVKGSSGASDRRRRRRSRGSEPGGGVCGVACPSTFHKTTPGVNYSTPALTQAPPGAPPLPPNPTWWGPNGSQATSRPPTILMTGPDGKIERNPDGSLRRVPLPSGPPAPPPGAPPLGTRTGY